MYLKMQTIRKKAEKNHQSETEDFPEVVQGEDSQIRYHSVESDQVDEVKHRTLKACHHFGLHISLLCMGNVYVQGPVGLS